MLDTIKKYLPLNFELMGNPVNWVIVVLMILIAGVALSVIMSYAPATQDATS